MNYAHWISFLIFMGVQPMPAASVQEWSSTSFEYPVYDYSQLVRSVTATLVRVSHRPIVSEIAVEQDATVQGLAEAKLEQLETQGARAA
jgi:lantibiotic modifying enzyme